MVNSIEARDATIQSGMSTGVAETYDRLEEHLRTMVEAGARGIRQVSGGRDVLPPLTTP